MKNIVLILIIIASNIFSNENKNLDSSFFFKYDHIPINTEFSDSIQLSNGEIIQIDPSKLTVVIFSDAKDSTLIYFSKFFNEYLINPNLEVFFIIYSDEEINLKNRFFKQYDKYYFSDMEFRKKYKLGMFPQVFFIHNNNLNFNLTVSSGFLKIAFQNYFYGRIKCFE